MERRKFSREVELEAVTLVRDRGVRAAQASRDLDVHANVLPKWVREAKTDPSQAFAGNGQVKPEPPEVVRLRKEVARLKAARDRAARHRRPHHGHLAARPEPVAFILPRVPPERSPRRGSRWLAREAPGVPAFLRRDDRVGW